jgi:hypothetical protein
MLSYRGSHFNGHWDKCLDLNASKDMPSSQSQSSCNSNTHDFLHFEEIH